MFSHIRKTFYNLSVRSKFVILFYSGIALMFLMLTLLLLTLAEHNARQDVWAMASKSVSYTNLIVEKEQQYLLGIASYYAIASEVQDLLRASNNGEVSNRLPENLLAVSQSRQYVLSVAFYNKYGENVDYFTIDGSYGAVDQDPTDPSRPIYTLLQGKKSYTWEYIEKDDTVYLVHDNSPKICLWYAVKDTRTWVPIGIMSITLDSRKLFPVDSVFKETGDNVLIVDCSKSTVFGYSKLAGSLTEELAGSLTEDSIASLIANVEPYKLSGTFHIVIGGIPYYAAYAKLSGTDFISFSLIEEQPFFLKTETLFLSGIIGIVFCLVILLPILILIANTLTRPLQQLMLSMERFRDGNRDAHVHFRYHDEIGRIGEIFNSMVKENKQLIEQTYLLTIRNQAAELAKLQAQINPHFIYNTLNAIQWTAIDKGDNEIAEMAYSIGQVFRLSLSHGNDLIPIGTERDLLYFYLSLQEKRFDGRLSYVLEFEEDLLPVLIPKLLIQPLVENASVHGAKSADSVTHIEVHVSRKNDRIRIVVSDDGVGIPPEILRLLPDRLTADTSRNLNSHFALKNISKRLQLYYNQDYLFQIDSTVGCGTTIVIEVPFTPHDI